MYARLAKRFGKGGSTVSQYGGCKARIHFPTCKASTEPEPTLPIESNSPDYPFRSRDAITAALSFWIYSPDEDLPVPGYTLVRLIRASENSPVQWAIVKSQDTMYVVFRGTKLESTLTDVIIDVSALPFAWRYDSDSDISIGVQGGMWTALHSQKKATAERIKDELMTEINALNSDMKIVLCGHSLGGGYAILCGLELLHMGVKIDAIVAHGAPQVITPDYSIDLWRRLNDITTVYINGFDVVPRLPSCHESWKDTLLNLGVQPLGRERKLSEVPKSVWTISLNK